MNNNKVQYYIDLIVQNQLYNFDRKNIIPKRHPNKNQPKYKIRHPNFYRFTPQHKYPKYENWISIQHSFASSLNPNNIQLPSPSPSRTPPPSRSSQRLLKRTHSQTETHTNTQNSSSSNKFKNLSHLLDDTDTDSSSSDSSSSDSTDSQSNQMNIDEKHQDNDEKKVELMDIDNENLTQVTDRQGLDQNLHNEEKKSDHLQDDSPQIQHINFLQSNTNIFSFDIDQYLPHHLTKEQCDSKYLKLIQKYTRNQSDHEIMIINKYLEFLESHKNIEYITKQYQFIFNTINQKDVCIYHFFINFFNFLFFDFVFRRPI